MFSRLKVEVIEDLRSENFLTKEEGRMQAARLLDQYKRGSLTQEEETKLYALLKVLKEDTDREAWVEDVLDSAFYCYEDKS